METFLNIYYSAIIFTFYFGIEILNDAAKQKKKYIYIYNIDLSMQNIPDHVTLYYYIQTMNFWAFLIYSFKKSISP